MEGANTGRSNTKEEVNPLEELCHTTSTTSTKNNLIAHTNKVLMHSTLIGFSSRRPDIQQLYYAQQTTNTTFCRDRCPDVPSFMFESQCCMTQPLTAQAASAKLAALSLPKCKHHTEIRDKMDDPATRNKDVKVRMAKPQNQREIVTGLEDVF
jgi:hypothetical protein